VIGQLAGNFDYKTGIAWRDFQSGLPDRRGGKGQALGKVDARVARTCSLIQGTY